MTEKRSSDTDSRAYGALGDEELQEESTETPHGTSMPEEDDRRTTLTEGRQEAIQADDETRRRESEDSLGAIGYAPLDGGDDGES